MKDFPTKKKISDLISSSDKKKAEHKGPLRLNDG